MNKLGFVLLWLIVLAGAWLGYRMVGGPNPFAGTGSTPAVASSHPRRLPPPPTLTAGAIFDSRAPSLARYDRRKLITLIASGDVIPARSVNYKMVTYNDFLYPFRPTAAYLRTGDVTLINLESPLINGCPVTDSGMQFCGDPRAVQGLTFSGVDVACTANNHIGNYGPQGVAETWQHLRTAGIQACGLDTTAYRTVKGIRFAFLAFNAVEQRFDYATARREIQAARRRADVVVVSMHWGKEYVPVPQVAPGVADDNPRTIAHWIIDSGADLIIGNHPHHVQGVELYHGHLITYAHGNFVFDQMFGIPDCPGDTNFLCTTREGVVGAYTFYGKRLVSVRYHPVVIYDYSQPRWATPAQAKVILHGMWVATQQLFKRT